MANQYLSLDVVNQRLANRIAEGKNPLFHSVDEIKYARKSPVFLSGLLTRQNLTQLNKETIDDINKVKDLKIDLPHYDFTGIPSSPTSPTDIGTSTDYLQTLLDTLAGYQQPYNTQNITAPEPDTTPNPSFSPIQLLAIKEDFQPLYDLADFPIEQIIEIFKAIRDRLRLIFYEGEQNNGMAFQTKSKPRFKNYQSKKRQKRYRKIHQHWKTSE